MKRIITLIAVMGMAVLGYSHIPMSKIINADIKSFKSLYALYSTTNDYYQVGYMDHYDTRLRTTDTSGNLWYSMGASSFGFEFSIIDDTTIYIQSITFCCDNAFGNEIFNMKERSYDYLYSVAVNGKAYLRNKNELHFDFNKETLAALNKTNILKDEYLSEVLYLYEIEQVDESNLSDD